jgi:hypothetical protein
MLLYDAELANDFNEDDGLSRDALRVPSRVAIERRRRRRRCRRPQLQTTQLASLFRNVADRLQRSTRVPRGSTATTSTSTQTPAMVEAAVQCQLMGPLNDDEDADESYDIDAADTESDFPTLPTFVHNVIDHHGHPVELYVASLPLSSPAARPTLKKYISPVCPPLPDDVRPEDENDNVSEAGIEHELNH